METTYSLKKTAELLGLHPKTVARLLREGRLRGHKVGREWRVRLADLRAYTGGAAAEAPRASRLPLRERVRVSAVVELVDCHEAEVTRISNALVAVLNGKDPAWGEARYDLIYHPEVGTARFILYGAAAFISGVLELLEISLSQGEVGP